jgi:hypothetical protein
MPFNVCYFCLIISLCASNFFSQLKNCMFVYIAVSMPKWSWCPVCVILTRSKQLVGEKPTLGGTSDENLAMFLNIVFAAVGCIEWHCYSGEP